MVESAEEPLCDDLLFSELDWQKAQEGKPLHLVCVTANDIGGEPLLNHKKGGRSAVLSRHGLWCDGCHREWAPGERITLSTALTISAAAFNSQMGRFTTRLGKGFAFLLSSLNLRLGCWVRHPNHPPKWQGSESSPSQTVSPGFLGVFGFPGSLFFRELFSDTKVAGRRYIHLSDGGHFENLGLYELVRRHCQYIIVTEAGTDPEAASADLADTLWRIQADFDIKIEIDVSGFTPDKNGETDKHIAVGSIHYSDDSEGVLIYLRTGITGDEPVEVERYRKANPAFPYESTADQFFDPEQWDAYRALGQHIGEEAFNFLSKRDAREGHADALGETMPISRIFQDTRWTWTKVPPSIQQKMDAINERQDQFLKEFMESAPERLLHQVYPGIAKLELKDSSEQSPPRCLDKEYKWARRVAAFIQHVWSELNLEKYADYPEMNPWKNLIDRWSRTDVVRITWPILRTLLEVEFVRFLEYSTNHRLNQGWSIWLSPIEIHSNYNEDVKFEIQVDPLNEGGEKIVWPIGRLDKIEVSRQSEDLLIAQWHYLDFTIEPGFRGAGLGTWTLRELVNNLHRTALRVGATELQIEVDFSDRSDQPESLSKNSMLRFYQEAEFTTALTPTGAKKAEMLTYRKTGLQHNVSLCCRQKHGNESRYLPVDLSQIGEHQLCFSNQANAVDESIVAELKNLKVSIEEIEPDESSEGEPSNPERQIALLVAWNYRDFTTDPAYRRQGWGGRCVSHLLHQLEDTARIRGLAQVRARAEIAGHDSHALPWPESEREEFYRRLGFKHKVAPGVLEYRRFLSETDVRVLFESEDDPLDVRFAEVDLDGDFTGRWLGEIADAHLKPERLSHDSIVGYVASWNSQEFRVDSKHQGRGVGSNCLRRVIEYLEENATADSRRAAAEIDSPVEEKLPLRFTIKLSSQEAIPNWTLEDEISFYRQCQFELIKLNREENTAEMRLTRFLHP